MSSADPQATSMGWSLVIVQGVVEKVRTVVVARAVASDGEPRDSTCDSEVSRATETATLCLSRVSQCVTRRQKEDCSVCDATWRLRSADQRAALLHNCGSWDARCLGPMTAELNGVPRRGGFLSRGRCRIECIYRFLIVSIRPCKVVRASYAWRRCYNISSLFFYLYTAFRHNTRESQPMIVPFRSIQDKCDRKRSCIHQRPQAPNKNMATCDETPDDAENLISMRARE